MFQKIILTAEAIDLSEGLLIKKIKTWEQIKCLLESHERSQWEVMRKDSLIADRMSGAITSTRMHANNQCADPLMRLESFRLLWKEEWEKSQIWFILCKRGKRTPVSWLRGSCIRHTWPQTRKEIETLFHSFLWQSSWPIFSWFQVILAWLQYVLEFGTNTCSRSSSRTWREWGRVCSFSGSQGIQGITLTSSSS